jgi:nitroimidazol reductase NimA-like FMN-containing flavoprotein (pyridoxamine 5'-phosphate oxidase superfamily)
VPLSFGFEAKGDRIVLYAHGAGEGYKHDLIAKNNHVCVEADVLHGYVAHGTGVTADYRSVIGFGTIEYVEDFEEKVKGLQLLLDHCRVTGYSARECALRPITTVLKITLTSISGKQRFSSR